ncbi:50S ribosomal protein L6 [Candidatus Shapirobacteria bacterium]|nr:MAG: 50S ribosomal protein L6 [Candidatus Shapirobacteria bacterium]
MSRIGKEPVIIPSQVKVDLQGQLLTVKGPKGELTLNIPLRIELEISPKQIKVKRLSDDKKVKSLHGTIRALIQNMVKGVVELWKKELEVRGTGYKASYANSQLTVHVGYIHPIVIDIPKGIQVEVHKDTEIIILGCDKILVGQIASNIRKIRKPEPYKGKGVRYKDEHIKLKPGKTAKA